MQRDNQIFELINREHLRQRCGVELIASENFVSDEVMRAMGSCLTNKYAEGYPAHRYYGGCQVVDEVENLAIERAKKLFDAEWANVQPHSGAQANMAVFMACLEPGDTFMGMDLSHGGHLSHGSPVNFSGLHFRPISYTVDAETGRVNYEEMEEKARAERPKLIIAGASAYSREWDYARVRKLADADRLFVALCAFHHRRLHDHGENDRKLQGIAQQAFIANEMTKYPSIDKNAMEEAKKTFYKRYLRFYE